MTYIIIGITLLFSILALSNEQLMRKWIFNPYLVNHQKQWYRFFSSGFIHADWMHLFVNMFVLYSFGQVVESYYGEVFQEKGGYYFVLLYLGGLLISSGPTYAKNKDNAWYNSLGASGAVSGILFAAILFNPWQKIYFWGIIGIPGILLGPLYLFYEWRSGQKGGDHINHDAHFWGAIFGVVFTIILKPAIAIHFFNALMQN